MKYREFKRRARVFGLSLRLHKDNANNLYTYVYSGKNMIAKISEMQSGKLSTRQAAFNKLPVIKQQMVLKLLCDYGATFISDRHAETRPKYIVPIFSSKQGKGVTLLSSLGGNGYFIPHYFEELPIQAKCIQLSDLQRALGSDVKYFVDNCTFDEVEIEDLERNQDDVTIDLIERNKKIIINDLPKTHKRKSEEDYFSSASKGDKNETN